MSRTLCALVLVATLVAGCSGNAAAPSASAVAPTPAPTATPSPTPTAAATPVPTASPTLEPTPAPTPTPTPALMTKDQAAKAYLAAWTKDNTAFTAAQKKYKNATTLKANRALYAALAKAEDAFIERLKAIPFPADIQPDAKALIRADIVFQAGLLAASKASSLDVLLYRAQAALKANEKAGDATAILRDDLGLPPAP